MKKVIAGIAGLLCMVSTQAQFIPRSLNSGNQQLIEEAVKGGIFIVRQSYQLKDIDTNTLYGWDNAEHFGYTLSLGIKAENGYYLEPKAVEPWRYDRRYTEYNDRRQYIPLVSESRYKSLTDSIFSVLPYEKDGLKMLAGGKFYFFRDSLFDNQGFETDDSDGRKEGWLVWLVSPDTLQTVAGEEFSLLVYRHELTFETGARAYRIKDPSTNNRVWGGFYIVPQTTGIGKISFRIGGLLSKREDYWQVVRLNEAVDRDEPRRDKPLKEGLTPIRQRNKSK
jgi:hypothetical protein